MTSWNILLNECRVLLRVQLHWLTTNSVGLEPTLSDLESDVLPPTLTVQLRGTLTPLPFVRSVQPMVYPVFQQQRSISIHSKNCCARTFPTMHVVRICTWQIKTVAWLLMSFTSSDPHVIAVSYPVVLRCVYLFRHTCFFYIITPLFSSCNRAATIRVFWQNIRFFTELVSWEHLSV